MSIDLRRRISAIVRDHPRLHDGLHPAWMALRRAARAARLRRYGAAMVHDRATGNRIIQEAILSGLPHAIGKVGSLEAEAARCFLAGRAYPNRLREQMTTNVGIFPASAESIDLFCRRLLAAVADVDILVGWGNPGEAEVLHHVDVPRRLIPIDSLEPWYDADPWSGALAGKRVVVLSPFARTIERQYARRAEIWNDTHVLPAFDLRTVRMPLSPALVPGRHGDWQSRFDAIVAEVEAAPYDVLIAGAGGISLPIAAHTRRQGRVGIHMGGLTQILFGIIGRRWEKSATIMASRTAAWTRPAADETPDAVMKVEQGCYW